MGISVIPHPGNPPREFPDIPTLYKKYPENPSYFLKTPVSLFDLVNFKSTATYSNLEYAAMWNDGEVIQHFLPVSESKVISAAFCAMYENNTSALQVLITNIHDKQVLKGLFVTALGMGQEQVVDALLKDERVLNIFNKEILPHGALHIAAASGNLNLLTKIINAYEQNEKVGPKEVSAAIVSEQAIISAINDGNSAQSVGYLIDRLSNEDQLSEEQILSYLELSIRKNSDELTAYFLEKLSPEAIKKLDMQQIDLRTIENMDLSLLQQLKKAGVQFTKLGNALIEQKASHHVGIFTSVRIQLGKFSDFVKSNLFPNETNKAVINTQAFRKELKKMLFSSNDQNKDDSHNTSNKNT